MMKKLLSTIVAIVCLLCNTIPIQAQNQEASVTSTTDYSWTVYFDNHKLTGEQMYIYVWDANHTTSNGVLGAFPGAAMTLNNKGIWEHTFTTSYELVSPMVLFSNGYDQQTQDYVFVNGKTYILEEIVSNGIYYAITSETDNTVEVTYRGNNAYEYENEYTGAITIPSTINHKGVDYTVTAIGRDAFMDCIGLTEVTLPETVTQIGSMAFWGCSGLKNFTIGKNISFIENNVFNLSGLTELHIEATTPPHINEYTLYGLNSIPLYVPNGTVNTYKSTLYWNNLANNIFEEGTKVYTWSATFHNTKFSGSDMYVYVWDEGNNNKELLGKWPGKIMNQKGGNMWDYTLLTTDVLVSPMIIFNNGAGSQTADLVFTNDMVYENLLSINVDGINYDVTRNGDMLSSGEVRITPTSNCNGEVVIPDFVTYNNNSYAVTNIADCAFQNNPQLTSVTIPRYIKKIGKQAFDGCTALTKVVWNAENCETYTEIEGNTLYMYPPFLDYETHTSNVKEIVFGEAVWVIPTALCANMENLTHIEYPEYLIEIGSYAFANCKSLATINIPEYVTTIGECAFAYCESVNTVTIPENVSSMGTAVFDGCKNITSVQWNAINCRINNHDANIYPVFFDSETQSCAVEQFVLGNKVEYIPRALCYSMNKVTSIDIPNTVKEIDDFAFYMSGLRSVTIPGSVTRLGTSAFWNCEGLENVTLSEGLSSIGDYAFSRCYNLSSIIIPNSVQTLGNEAFF